VPAGRFCPGARLVDWTTKRPLRSNEAVRLIAALWRLLRDLVRDLATSASGRGESGDEQARADDILDATLDEDGMDATGL
jgi:hypothetical protein